jgi:hypothetical protein
MISEKADSNGRDHFLQTQATLITAVYYMYVYMNKTTTKWELAKQTQQ